MHRKLMLILLSLVVWPIPPFLSDAVQRPAQEAAVFQLRLGLGSSICANRWQALEKYLRSSGDRLRPLRQSLRTANPSMRARLALVVTFLEEDANARSRVQAWEREFTQIAVMQDGAKQSSELENMHRRLVNIIRDPKESFGPRLDAASFLAVLVTEFAPAPTAAWAGEFPGLLRSTDGRVRLVGAMLYARGMLFKAQAPQMGTVIPVLINGLKWDSFEERLRSQRGLFYLTSVSAEQVCADPTDPRPQRTEGIRQWEAWWAANKGKRAKDKVPQHY